ncbi:MAG: hypothetical protein HQK65_15445 [Desulfamplus sp.]|nr:hypothetical protein [Desulfamplus sp.]
MAVKVKINDIIGGLEFQTDESASFLNKKTGEIVTITEEEFRAVENDELLNLVGNM